MREILCNPMLLAGRKLRIDWVKPLQISALARVVAVGFLVGEIE
jgi:hypothetical protein